MLRLRKRLSYLGPTIRPGLLEGATKNTTAIEGFKEPMTQTPMCSFIGWCNIYRRFVPNFARVAAPLNKMLQNSYDFQLPAFNDDEPQAFITLKAALAHPPILQLPCMGAKLSVDTDACDYQVGCALMQEDEETGERHPIGFWNRGRNSTEKNYSRREKECLPVVWAVQILRLYLRGVMSISDASGRLPGWHLRLLEHEFTVHYRKGLKNQIADAVSRLPTWGETKIAPNLQNLCFVVEADLPWPYMTAPEDGSEEGGEGVAFVDEGEDMVLAAVHEPEGTEPQVLSVAEIIESQATDNYCQDVRRRVEEYPEYKRYTENNKVL